MLDGRFLAKRKIILGGAEHEDEGLLALDGPLLAKRKIILDGAEHVDG